VVGIVKDVRQMGMDLPVSPEMYFPYRQIKSLAWFGPRDLVIRTSLEPRNIIEAVRAQIHATDPVQPISNSATLSELLAEETRPRWVGMVLVAIFAGLALLLASLGIYGVLSYFVTQQTAEIGIRLALGAQGRDILNMILLKGMRWVVCGVAIGLFAAWALTKLMASLLFGVSATDPITFATVPFLLIGVALAGCLIPAWRAIKVDPIIALRYE